jgi:hypothetical protein
MIAATQFLCLTTLLFLSRRVVGGRVSCVDQELWKPAAGECGPSFPTQVYNPRELHFTLLSARISSHDNMQYHYLHVSAISTEYFYLIEQQQWLASRCHDYMNHDRTTVIPYALQSRETSASDSLVGLSHVTASAHPACIVVLASPPC